MKTPGGPRMGPSTCYLQRQGAMGSLLLEGGHPLPACPLLPLLPAEGEADPLVMHCRPFPGSSPLTFLHVGTLFLPGALPPRWPRPAVPWVGHACLQFGEVKSSSKKRRGEPDCGPGARCSPSRALLAGKLAGGPPAGVPLCSDEKP